jgi:deoxyribodipyrimidine photo-lyase
MFFFIKTVLLICSILFYSCLLTYRDTPENVLNQFIQQYKDIFEISIGFHQEVTKEETDVEKAIHQLARDNKVHVKEFWTSTLYHFDDLPYNNPKAYVDAFVITIMSFFY